MEAYVSVLASEFSDGQALQALKLLKEYLPASYHEGSKNPVARERVHSASDYRGYRVCERLPGCMSLNGRTNWVPSSIFRTGLANALLICNVIATMRTTTRPSRLHSASMTVRRLAVVMLKLPTTWV
ncbi:bifunctional acetaldehyde-CoA/alcohol dehydrogenase [Escherichia coli]|nr:bifunctional acetaldehyde-CoA/alcohol dehydrogenase [Escherichia coli]